MKLGSWASVFGIYLFGICGASTVSKIIPLSGDMGSSFGLEPANFGWLVSLIAVPAAIFAIPSGIVVDRLGAKRVLLLAALGGIIANAIYLYSPALVYVQVARILEGFAIVHIYTAGPAMLMATTEGNKRTRAMTLWSTYAPVGTALGIAVGGLFAESDDWKNTFLLHGILFAVAGALCFLQPNVETSQVGSGQTVGQRLKDLGLAFVSPKLVLLAAAFFLLISMGLGANVAFPSHLAGVHHISLHESSNLVASTTLAMILGSLSVGLLLPLGIRPPILLTVVALTSFAFGALCFYPEVSLASRYIVMFGWFVSTGATMATMLAMLPMVAQSGRQGSAAALINFVGAVATFLNPPLWLGISASGEWTPFIALLAVGWSLVIVLIWAAAIMMTRTKQAQPA